MNKYTKEQREFFVNFVPGHTRKEIQEEFEKKFNTTITLSAIKGYIGNHKLNTGFTGRFEKGHTPFNKGVKGVSYPGQEKTQFKKGNVPINHKPIGSERITKDGYIEIKISEPNKWMLRQRLVWEKENGPIPKNHVIVFKDRNKINVNIENLAIVSRGELARLNQNNLFSVYPEITEAGINVAKLIQKVSERKNKK